jgi:hypothetical protein
MVELRHREGPAKAEHCLRVAGEDRHGHRGLVCVVGGVEVDQAALSDRPVRSTLLKQRGQPAGRPVFPGKKPVARGRVSVEGFHIHWLRFRPAASHDGNRPLPMNERTSPAGSGYFHGHFCQRC